MGRLFIFYYLFTKIVLLLNWQSTKEAITFSKDIILEPSFYELNKDRFMFGVRIRDGSF